MPRLLMLSAMIALCALAFAQQTLTAPQPPRTISVSESAERQFTPDLGIVVVAVQTQADTVARAVNQNNTNAGHVLDAIKRLNIPRLTLRTLGYDVSPMYEQPTPGRPAPNPPRIVGYQVVNRIEVRIPQENPDQLSAAVGRVVDAALDAGANRVDQVSFTLVDPSAAMREVLAAATRSARLTAAMMAEAAGVTLGPLLNLSASPYFQPPQPLYARAEAAAAAAPIVAGELTVRASVSAVYEIR